MPNAQCLGDVARALKQLPFVGASIPDGVDTLVGATCEIIAPSASASLQSLADYLAAQGPVLLGLAAMATGVSTKCEAALARASLASAALLCVQAGAKCLDELVQGLPTVPLVGRDLPGSVPPLFDGICAFAARAQGFAELAAQTLPKLLKIVGLARGSTAAAHVARASSFMARVIILWCMVSLRLSLRVSFRLSLSVVRLSLYDVFFLLFFFFLSSKTTQEPLVIALVGGWLAAARPQERLWPLAPGTRAQAAVAAAAAGPAARRCLRRRSCLRRGLVRRGAACCGAARPPRLRGSAASAAPRPPRPPRSSRPRGTRA
jgi:hypothetical protein